MNISGEVVNVKLTYDYSHEYAANTIYLIATVLMLCMGLVGNTLVIGAVLVHKRLRVLANSFLVNLTVADLCLTTFVDSFSVVCIATQGRFFADRHSLCELLGVVCVMACTCSTWNIAHISFNRYVRICHHQIYPKMYNKRTIPFIILGTRVVCFHIDLPNLVGWGAPGFDPRVMMCTYDYTKSYTYTVFGMVTGFVSPLLVTSVSYISIVVVVKRAERNVRRVNDSETVQSISAHAGNDNQQQKPVGAQSSRTKIRKTDIRLPRSVFTIWIVFIFMWAPYALTVMLDFNYTWPRLVYVVAITLAHGNSGINGILYAATNRHFREGYAYLIKRFILRQR